MYNQEIVLTIGEIIRKKRNELGLTQADVANSIGVCMQHYSRIERGIYVPSLQTFLSICEVLDFDIRQLVTSNG